MTTNKLTRLLIYYLLEGQNNVLMTSKPMKLRHLSDDELRNWARQYAVPSFDKLDRDSLLRYLTNSLTYYHKKLIYIYFVENLTHLRME